VKGSLRTRLFVGALVWMTAVFVVVTALLLKVARNHPEFAMPGATYHTAMGLFAGAFVVGGLFLVRRALAPFGTLRAGLSSVREGRSRRIEGDYPAEVQPLVNDLNALLEDRERAIARALTTAGDLAHGLKTPLAVLAQEAEQAGAEGHHDLATTLHQLIERMQRQVTITWLAHVRPHRRVQRRDSAALSFPPSKVSCARCGACTRNAS
jgi:signal transduction histidine kinase